MEELYAKLDSVRLELDKDDLCDELVTDLIQSGVDLRNYSVNVNKQLRKVENACVADYINESTNIAHLHQQITQSDQILERIEGMLCNFQANLGNICQEILSLQEQSVALNVRLKNKQEVRSELSQFLDDLVLPEAVITHILETPAQEKEFLEQLQTLDQKISFVSEQSFKQATACTDVLGMLNNLKLRAIAKIAEYISRKVHSFRKPMSNYQIPQSALLQKKFFFAFLLKHQPELAADLRNEYVGTFSKVYYSYFKEYLTRLSRLRFEELPDKDDLLAAAEDASKSRNSFFVSKSSLKTRSAIFSLGNRSSVIGDQAEGDLIVPHTAHKSDQRYSMEALFRSHQYALVDNACREYLFITEFFDLRPPQALQLFQIMFAKTTQHTLKCLEEEFATSHDCLALFLCLHIVYRFRLICHKRAVSALDLYWEQLVQFLWPRFEQLWMAHINSVRVCDVTRLSGCDTRPHFITRRYAEFSAGIMSVNDTFPDERVSVLLGQLQVEVENFILKLASRFNSPKEQLLFLINNYDMVLGVLLERTKEESKESEKIKQQLSKRVHDFVHELLYPHFGPMISFVKDCEAYIERNDQIALSREECKVGAIVKNFNGDWRKSIEDINGEVMTSFTNFKCGNGVQQEALKEIIQYYHRFHKIVSQAPFKANPARASLLNVHQLMVEIKKYKSAF
jgi:hypothetical protein